MKKDIAIILIFMLFSYPLIVLAAHYTQSYAIFQSRGASFRPPKNLAIEELVLTTADGERLNAWWLETKNAEKTILYFQGNGTNVSHKVPRLNTFRKMGVNGLITDYRGYGKSTGRIKSETDIYTDGLTAWNYLTAGKGIDPEDIIIWGRSLGGGVAVEVARYKDIAALILESTFYSMDEIVQRQYWFLPIYTCRQAFQSRSRPQISDRNHRVPRGQFRSPVGHFRFRFELSRGSGGVAV